jgi:transcriptional regulator with XRE-family HTH domain
MNIGDRIKEFRKRNNLDQQQLAELLNVSAKTVSSWEVNRTQPKMEFIVAMCKIFKCRKTDFLDDYNDSDEESPDQLPREYAVKYAELDYFGKKNVHLAIDAEYEKKEDFIKEYRRIILLDEITSIDDAKIILGPSAAFGGSKSVEQILEMANVVLKEEHKNLANLNK